MGYWGPLDENKEFWIMKIDSGVKDLIEKGSGKQIIEISDLTISEAIDYKHQIQDELLRLSELVERLKSLEYLLSNAVRDGKRNA